MEDVLVERQIRHRALQLRILLTELAQLEDLAHAEVGVFLLPDVERRLADAELPADIRHRDAAFGLPQRISTLLIGESQALHRLDSFGPSGPFVQDRQRHFFPGLNRHQNRDTGQSKGIATQDP